MTGGFEGQLKLQRRGRSVPIQMSAKVPTPDDKKFEPPTPEDKKSEPHVEKATSSEDFVLEVQNVAEEVGPVIPESESQSEDNVEVEGPKDWVSRVDLFKFPKLVWLTCVEHPCRSRLLRQSPGLSRG